MKIEMLFSPDVSFNGAVANLTNPALFHEFYSNMEPTQVKNFIRTGDSASYESILALNIFGNFFGKVFGKPFGRTFGIRTRMLSVCKEKISDLPQKWQRQCNLKPSEYDGGTFMDWKSDEILCSSEKASGQVRCHLEVKGKLKDLLFLKSPVLTVKAKAQALTNWGRFWYYLNTGSISTKYSNLLFDQSKLNDDIHKFLEDGLKKAKLSSDFYLMSEGKFETL